MTPAAGRGAEEKMIESRRTRTPAVARLLGALALLAAGGCALSPQTVSPNPEIALGDLPSRGGGRRIALEVVDARDSITVGHRGGIYDTAAIQTSANWLNNIHTALSRAYGALGFLVVPAAADAELADLALRVEIAKLEYAAEGKNPVTGASSVATRAEVRAIGTLGDTTMTSTYRERLSKNVLTAPGEAENVELLNEVLSKVLTRLVADRRLTEGE
jgi:uncharacterized lipoprotein